MADLGLPAEVRADIAAATSRIKTEVSKRKPEPNAHDTYIRAKNLADNLSRKADNALEKCNLLYDQLQDAMKYHQNRVKELDEAKDKVKHFAAKARSQLELPSSEGVASGGLTLALSAEDANNNNRLQALIDELQQRQLVNDATVSAVEPDQPTAVNDNDGAFYEADGLSGADGIFQSDAPMPSEPASDKRDHDQLDPNIYLNEANAQKKNRVAADLDALAYQPVVDDQGSASTCERPKQTNWRNG